MRRELKGMAGYAEHLFVFHEAARNQNFRKFLALLMEGGSIGAMLKQCFLSSFAADK